VRVPYELDLKSQINLFIVGFEDEELFSLEGLAQNSAN
jgi:hypothetical protein